MGPKAPRHVFFASPLLPCPFQPPFRPVALEGPWSVAEPALELRGRPSVSQATGWRPGGDRVATAGWFGDRALLVPLAYPSLDALLRARVERADGKADGTTDDERDHAGDRREKRRVHQHEPEDADDNDRQAVQA